MNRGKTEAELIKREIESQLADIKLKPFDISPDNTSSTTRTSKATTQTDVATIPTGYNFVNPLNDSHRCQLCFGSLNQPYMLLCCGNLICYSHISSIADKCPFCCKTSFELIKYHRIKKNIKALPVKCTAKDCYWSGPLEDLEKHICPETKEIHLKKKEWEEAETLAQWMLKKIFRKGRKISYRLEKDQPAFRDKGVQTNTDARMLHTVSDTNSKEIDCCNIALAGPSTAQIPPSQFHSFSSASLQCAIRILNFRDGKDYEVCIIVTKNIENHMEQAINRSRFNRVRSANYESAVADTLVLVADKIEVKTDKESSDHMWEIKPTKNVCEIHKADIEKFNGSQDIPPCLNYYVMMKEPENCSSQLILHDFVFEGTEGNVCLTVKIHNPQKQACVSTETCYEGIDRQGGEVSSAHLGLLSDKLWDLQSDMEQFAHALPVPGYIIRGIKTSYPQTSQTEKFQQMMEKWRMKGGNRTWWIIHIALTKVRKKDMADNVLKKYPNLDTNVPFDEDGYTSIMTDVLRDVIPLWSLFGLQLGLSDSEIQEIKGEGFQPMSMLNDLLRLWIGLKGSDANIIDIIIACEKIGHGELAQQLKADSEMCHAFPVLVKLK